MTKPRNPMTLPPSLLSPEDALRRAMQTPLPKGKALAKSRRRGRKKK